MTVETPVNDASSTPVTVSEYNTVDNRENPTPTKVKGPADDLRSIQNLLVAGIFPGNLAPAVVAGFNLLENMARRVEASPNPDAKETK